MTDFNDRFNNDEYDVTYYHVGDGICVIRKRVA